MQPNVIKFPRRMAQVASFQNLQINGFTPSDIDVAYEIGGHTFIFGELKRKGKGVPQGQSLLLKHLADALEAAGKRVLVFLAEHDTDPDEDIDVGNLPVKFMRYNHNGKQYKLNPKNTLVKEICEKFVK